MHATPLLGLLRALQAVHGQQGTIDPSSELRSIEVFQQDELSMGLLMQVSWEQVRELGAGCREL